jgi:hypothetical protein
MEINKYVLCDIFFGKNQFSAQAGASFHLSKTLFKCTQTGKSINKKAVTTKMTASTVLKKIIYYFSNKILPDRICGLSCVPPVPYASNR